MSGRSTAKLIFCAITAAVLGSLTQPAQTQPKSPPADVARGEHIARFACATCHVVARDQEFKPILSYPAPSFFDIANRPGVSAESLAHFISTTHWDPDKLEMTMPALMASPDQTQAVASYILSLKRHP